MVTVREQIARMLTQPASDEDCIAPKRRRWVLEDRDDGRIVYVPAAFSARDARAS